MDDEFRVGEWLIQPQLNRIEGPGDQVTGVEPKAMEVLVYLAAHPGRVLPKERIIQAVWPDAFVTDDVLAHAVSELRKAFNDDAKNPRVILTVPRRGYRLMLPVNYAHRAEAELETHSWLSRVSRNRSLPWLLAGLLAGALVLVLWSIYDSPSGDHSRMSVRRLMVNLGTGFRLLVDAGTGPAVVPSRDGSKLAFVAEPEEGGERRIYLRRLEELEATPIPGTEGVRHPIFSPDDQWIVFRAHSRLKKIPVSGGAAVDLCDTALTRGMDWSEDGSIFVALGSREGLSRVSANGGDPEPLTEAEGNEFSHRWPQVLPGGKAVLFTAGQIGRFEDASIVALRMETGELKVVWKGGYFARYLPSGHLIYTRENTLFAARFDVEALEIRSQPVPVLTNVLTNSRDGRAEVAFTDTGTLVYLSGPSEKSRGTLAWLKRDGTTEILLPDVSLAGPFRFSPDGRRLAIGLFDRRQLDIWVLELDRKALNRLTISDFDDVHPVWSPTGGAIVFVSNREGEANLYWQRVAGGGQPQPLAESVAVKDRFVRLPSTWHPSGRFLVVAAHSFETGWDLHVIHLKGDDQSGWKAVRETDLLTSPANEGFASFSPDGRWLAFVSDESGRSEVYVRSFPDDATKKLVSIGGGTDPSWFSDGSGLVYRWGNQIFTVTLPVNGASLNPTEPKVWSDRAAAEAIQSNTSPLSPMTGTIFDSVNFNRIAPDPESNRLLIWRLAESLVDQEGDSVVLIENFFEYLKEKVPEPPRGR